jgi:hypothetical protein
MARNNIVWTNERRQLHAMATFRGKLRSQVEAHLAVEKSRPDYKWLPRMRLLMYTLVKRFAARRYEILEGFVSSGLVFTRDAVRHLDECLEILCPILTPEDIATAEILIDHLVADDHSGLNDLIRTLTEEQAARIAVYCRMRDQEWCEQECQMQEQLVKHFREELDAFGSAS